MRQLQQPASWSHRAKAIGLFTLTTASYCLARMTGWLPRWSVDEPLSNDAPRSHISHLLQQPVPVMVTNPVPDQIIPVEQPYLFQLDTVFSGNYQLLSALQTGEDSLPDWMSVQCKQIGNMSIKTIVNGLNGVTSAKILNNTLFVTDKNLGLLIIDIRDRSNPRLLSIYPLNALEVGISGVTAFVAGNAAGALVLNITNLTNPQLITTYPPGSMTNVLSVSISGTTLWMGGGAGMQIMDVSNLKSPQSISTDSIAAYRLLPSGNLAFMTGGFSSNLRIYNASNIKKLQLINTYSGGSWVVQGFTALDNILLLANGYGGLQVIDTTNPTRLRVLSNYSAQLASIYGATMLNSSVFFLADSYGGFQIIDLHQGNLVGLPPVSLSKKRYSITVQAYDNSTLKGMTASTFMLTLDQFPRPVKSALDQSLLPNQRISLPLNSESLFINPRKGILQPSLQLKNGQPAPAWSQLSIIPIQSASFSTGGGYVRGLVINGSIVFMAADSAGLQIINVSNLQKLQLLGTYPLSKNNAIALTLSGSAVFLLLDNLASPNLLIIDVSNLNNPLLISTLSAPNAVSMTISNQTLFTTSSFDLALFNVSNLLKPQLLGTYPPPRRDFAYSFALSGTTLFFLGNYAGLQIIDVRNLASPRWISNFSGWQTGAAFASVVSNNIAFVAGYGMDLQFINISNLSKPEIINHYPGIIVTSYQTIVVNGALLLTPGVGNLKIIDISRPSNPFTLGVYFLNNALGGLAVSSNKAFLGTDSGLLILDLSVWQLIFSPGIQDVGNYPMRLIAKNNLGGSSFIEFTVRVEGPPQLNGSIPLQQGWVDQPFSYFVAPNLFFDPNQDMIDYSAHLAGEESLPSWLQFNPRTISFGGVPRFGDAGNFTLILSATDHICSQTSSLNFIVSIGFLPVLSRKIANQLAPIGYPFQFSIPQNSFYDPSGIALSYLAQGVHNQALPDWLQFNSTSLKFYGVANTSSVTLYTLQLIASNSAGGQTIATFTLLTDHFPIFNKILTPPIATMNEPWVWTLPSGMAYDADADPISFSASQEGNADLPPWLSFNPIMQTFTGLPTASGIQTIQLTIQDIHGGINRTYFNLTILTTTSKTSDPMLTTPSGRVGKSFVFVVPPDSFGVNVSGYNYSASLTDGSLLPPWLQFIANNFTLTGLPRYSDIGSYNITLMAQSPYAQFKLALVITINPNYPPQIYLPVSSQTAHVGQQFVFFLSKKTFMDPNGDTLTYSVNSLPQWLSFDSRELKFWGIPGRSDTDPLTSHLVNVELTAHDDQSQASILFNISVQGTSNLLLFLQVGISVLSGLFSLWGAYKKRALLLNHCCRHRIFKETLTVKMDENFQVALKTPREDIRKLYIKVPKNRHSTTGCFRFFGSTQKTYPLPRWLKYFEEKNCLRPGEELRESYPAQFKVEVLGKDDVILEEKNFTIAK